MGYGYSEYSDTINTVEVKAIKEFKLGNKIVYPEFNLHYTCKEWGITRDDPPMQEVTIKPELVEVYAELSDDEEMPINPISYTASEEKELLRQGENWFEDVVYEN